MPGQLENVALDLNDWTFTASNPFHLFVFLQTY